MERHQGCRMAVESLKFFSVTFAGQRALYEWEHCGQESSYVLANSINLFGMTYCGQHKMIR